MSLLRRLERRFRRFAIPNLTALIIFGQAGLYVMQQMRPEGVLDRIALIPERVLDGEVWRVITFLFDPPAANFLFALIFWWIFYLFGSALENQWGTVRYNLFLLIGYVANVAAAFIAHGLGAPAIATNAFLYGSVFLAFARLYPEFVLYLMFILPVKVKWLALLQWILYGIFVVSGTWIDRMLVVASIANYLLFFGREHWQDYRHAQRRRAYQAKTSKTATEPKHECRVCGKNSDDSPRTLFRYCSKCSGQVCYCPDHIRDHEHVE